MKRKDPDVVILDIEMPDLDGISALPLLLAKKRNLIIIMASTLTRRNAEISFKALSLGAADYIPKPESTREATAAETFHHDLIQKIRHLGARARRRALPAASPAMAPAPERARELSVQPVAAPVAQLPLARRPFSMLAPRVLLIGSSTGGPQALMTLVADIGPVIDRFPVLITQHMPPTFTTILAEHLSRAGAKPVREAVDAAVKPVIERYGIPTDALASVVPVQRLQAAVARVGAQTPELDQARLWLWLGLLWGEAAPPQAYSPGEPRICALAGSMVTSNRVVSTPRTVSRPFGVTLVTGLAWIAAIAA